MTDMPGTEENAHGEAIEQTEQELTGSCFIVGAPIEEREDITQRGIRALQSADLVVTGDEKHAASLMKRYAISKKLLGIGPGIERDVLETVLKRLREGKRVVILSAPSFMIFPALGRLIAEIRDAGLEPRVMPGVDVATTAIVMSGFPANRYYVAGRLPARSILIEDFADRVSTFDVTVVVDGGAARLRSSLEIFGRILGDRPAAVILRPTVPGEVIRRGPASRLPEHFTDTSFRGDWILVVGPTVYSDETEDAAIGSEDAQQSDAPESPDGSADDTQSAQQTENEE